MHPLHDGARARLGRLSRNACPYGSGRAPQWIPYLPVGCARSGGAGQRAAPAGTSAFRPAAPRQGDKIRLARLTGPQRLPFSGTDNRPTAALAREAMNENPTAVDRPGADVGTPAVTQPE